MTAAMAALTQAAVQATEEESIAAAFLANLGILQAKKARTTPSKAGYIRTALAA